MHLFSFLPENIFVVVIVIVVGDKLLGQNILMVHKINLQYTAETVLFKYGT